MTTRKMNETEEKCLVDDETRRDSVTAATGNTIEAEADDDEQVLYYINVAFVGVSVVG